MDSKDKKQLAKKRKEAAKQAQKFHREQDKQEKQNKKASQKILKANSAASKKGEDVTSKIKEAVSARRDKRQAERRSNLSREEKFRRDGKEKIRNLRPQDHEDGYYVDEYAEKQRQERRAKVIRRQEREVIRRNKKPLSRRQVRFKHILLSATIVLGVLLVGVVLCFTVLFKTEKIEVEGDSYYDRQQIIDFCNVAEQQNIFIGTWNRTPEEVVKNLPYVEKADVSFSIPDTIKITVKNAVPTYAIQDGEGYLTVSSKGRILDTTPVITEDLVELKCGEIKDKTKGNYIDFGDETVSDILHSVAKSFAVYGVDKVTAFDITNLSGIIITYDNHIDINIGLPDDIEYKIKTAFTIINEKLDPNQTGTVAGTLDVSTCNKTRCRATSRLPQRRRRFPPCRSPRPLRLTAAATAAQVPTPITIISTARTTAPPAAMQTASTIMPAAFPTTRIPANTVRLQLITRRRSRKMGFNHDFTEKISRKTIDIFQKVW